MVIEKQVTWLDDYKKEIKTLMYELDNLDQKVTLKTLLQIRIIKSRTIISVLQRQFCRKIRISKTNTKMNFGDLFYPERWQEDRMEKCNMPSIFPTMNGNDGT